MAVVNAMVLYNLSVDPDKRLSGFEFRKHLAQELIGGRSYRKTADENGGRPQKQPQQGAKGHYPVYIAEDEKRGACSFQCKSDRDRLHQCTVKCERCDMFFCLNTERNCFRTHVMSYEKDEHVVFSKDDSDDE